MHISTYPAFTHPRTSLPKSPPMTTVSVAFDQPAVALGGRIEINPVLRAAQLDAWRAAAPLPETSDQLLDALSAGLDVIAAQPGGWGAAGNAGGTVLSLVLGGRDIAKDWSEENWHHLAVSLGTTMVTLIAAIDKATGALAHHPGGRAVIAFMDEQFKIATLTGSTR